MPNNLTDAERAALKAALRCFRLFCSDPRCSACGSRYRDGKVKEHTTAIHGLLSWDLYVQSPAAPPALEQDRREGCPACMGHDDGTHEGIFGPSAPASSPASDANALTTVTVNGLRYEKIHDQWKVWINDEQVHNDQRYPRERFLAALDRIADLERQRASDARELAALTALVVSLEDVVKGETGRAREKCREEYRIWADEGDDA